MVFSSTVFLFLYLPIFLCIYFISPHAFRLFVLLIFSLLFYFWGENFLLWIVLLSTMVDYLCGIVIATDFKSDQQVNSPTLKRTRLQKSALAFSLITNLMLLGYFKYYNFGVDNLVSLLEITFGVNDALRNVTKVTLPLGISFYTFQSMSYTIDVYKGEVRATRNFIRFASYVTMFPQLVAGPIVRYRDIENQLLNHHVELSQFAQGIRRFTIGLAKKVLIANTVAGVADAAFNMPSDQLYFSAAWLGGICYTLQIYYDFSGYSDMAIGLGMMIGFTFPENFMHPYSSKSIKEFWRRWHITLSTWLRDYLYISLGGSRGSTIRTYVNLLVVFFLCGLWHGASWTFVVWGLYHGIFLIIERTRFRFLLEGLPVSMQRFYVLITVIFGWIIFRSENISEAASYIMTMVGLRSPEHIIRPLGELAQTHVLIAIIIGILFSFPIVNALKTHLASYTAGDGIQSHIADMGINIAKICLVFILLLLCLANLSSNVYNPFLYFRF